MSCESLQGLLILSVHSYLLCVVVHFEPLVTVNVSLFFFHSKDTFSFLTLFWCVILVSPVLFTVVMTDRAVTIVLKSVAFAVDKHVYLIQI